MFERFTDRARRVLVVAETEARSLGHSFIGSEHILLGLLQGDGVAAKVLSEHGAHLEVARQTISSSIPSSEDARQAVKVPFSPQAKHALELSLREALRLGHNYIGTEHLLLALVAQPDASAWLTEAAGAEPQSLRSSVEDVLKGHASDQRRSPAVNESIARARGLAGKGVLTTGHLLSSMLQDARSMASAALRGLGVSTDAVETALARISVDETSDASPRPSQVELRVGKSTFTVDDPDVARALMDLTPKEVKAALQKLVGGQRRKRKPPRTS